MAVDIKPKEGHFIIYDRASGDSLIDFELNPSQRKFMNSTKKFVLFSGGYGCGKSLVLTLKAIQMAEKYPGNYILMGRKTYPELRDTLMKEFFSLVPPALYTAYLKAEGRVIWHNGSEIIFRHLDTMAESEIRSLNLGCALIDQAEDISEQVVNGLKGRLRRAGVANGDRKIYMSCNPALTWLFKAFKQDPQPEYEVIEASTLENRKNLPEEYVNDLLKYPESYKKQYVYGVWDSELLSDKVVFAREFQERMQKMVRVPIRQREGLDIYEEHNPDHRYQMGVDPSEGGEGDEDRKDNASITIADMTAEEEVASWSGKLAPDVLAEKAAMFAKWYQTERNPCIVVPEMNSMGLAFVNAIRDDPEIRLYRRVEFDKTSKKKMLKLGWRTTRSTKPLVVSHFQELLRLRQPKVYAKKKIEQFKTFIYTDLVNKMGMGAAMGFHDDELMSLFLAFWEDMPVVAGSVHSPTGHGDLTGGLDNAIRRARPFLNISKKVDIIEGKVRFRFKPEMSLETSGRSWKT